MPLIIPYELEQFIHQLVADALTDAGMAADGLLPILIPVHEPGKGTAILPDLHETVEPSGNIRFWVVGNELMWAGLDRRIDEVFEVLWSLFHWHVQTHTIAGFPNGMRFDQGLATYHLALEFRHRLTPVLESHDGKTSANSQEARFEASGDAHRERFRSRTLSPREALLFREWAFHVPMVPQRNYNDSDRGEYCDEDDMIYPFPDDLFWKEGDEGDADRDGVIPWHDVESSGDEAADDGSRASKSEAKDAERKRKRMDSGL